MKFLVLFACLISFVAASGYYGHHIPARVDVAPGGVETILTHKVVPQVVSVLLFRIRCPIQKSDRCSSGQFKN